MTCLSRLSVFPWWLAWQWGQDLHERRDIPGGITAGDFTNYQAHHFSNLIFESPFPELLCLSSDLLGFILIHAILVLDFLYHLSQLRSFLPLFFCWLQFLLAFPQNLLVLCCHFLHLHHSFLLSAPYSFLHDVKDDFSWGFSYSLQSHCCLLLLISIFHTQRVLLHR